MPVESILESTFSMSSFFVSLKLFFYCGVPKNEEDFGGRGEFCDDGCDSVGVELYLLECASYFSM